MTPIRIVVVDDHHLVRAGLLALLNSTAGIEVIGETGSGGDAIRLILELQPDLALIDLSMPGVTGYQVITEVRKQAAASKLIALSIHATEDHVCSALKLGADGYLTKNAAPNELELAIRTVLNGGIWLPVSVSREMITAFLDRASHRSEITARQSTVLKMLAEGQRTKEIAFALGISVKTVETYKQQLMNRLDLEDVPSLVRYAIRNGISEL